MKKRKEEVGFNAEQLYQNGLFYCSEAVLKAVIEGFGIKVPHHIIAMASGFPVGIGGAECTCGAISGGVMAIGYFFGRSEGGSSEVEKSMHLSKELYDRFIHRNRCSCCKALTKNMTKGSDEHMLQCVRFTGDVARDCVEIIERNLSCDRSEDMQ